MTIEEALHKAVAEGYGVQSFDGIEMYYSGANNEYSVWTRTDNHSSFMELVEKTASITASATFGHSASPDGRVTDLHFTMSHLQPKLIAIDGSVLKVEMATFTPPVQKHID